MVSGSFDQTARIWDVRQALALHLLRSTRVRSSRSGRHSTGRRLRHRRPTRRQISGPLNGQIITTCNGHRQEVSKVVFAPQDTKVLTASDDCTSSIWDSDISECLEVLMGHTDYILGCAFNYTGDCIISASRDNTVEGGQ
jgi:dynein assembly factor with WDR repeat domains 1